MEIYTIGFTKKTAAQFFGLLKASGIKRLVDVRLNNSSQLAGFTKMEDLKFFLKDICGAEYVHEPLLAPSDELLQQYRTDGNWRRYEQQFDQLLASRTVEETVPRTLFDLPTVLLCSEATADKCHRRIVAEYLQRKWGDITIVHL